MIRDTKESNSPTRKQLLSKKIEQAGKPKGGASGRPAVTADLSPQKAL